MSEYRLRPAAEADLEEIWTYSTQAWSEEQAQQYVAAIFANLRRLVRHPEAGQSMDWLRPGVRRFRSSHHIIFYVIARDTAVDVIRILHDKRDVSRHLGSS